MLKKFWINLLNFQQEISQKRNESLWNIHWTKRIGFTHQIGCWGSAHNMVTKSAWFDSICNFQNLRFYANLRLKISVTKFRDSKIGVDSFKVFSISFPMVCSFFSLDAVFMKNFVKQNEHFYNFFGGKMKKATIKRQICTPKNLSWFFFIWAHHPSLSERNILHSKTLIRDQRWQFQD